MAERRMFARIITESDAFLDMPLSTQALYLHFGMSADDDGFINNPKKIQRMIGAADDDFKLLIAKRFIIPFSSGVIVVKHWKINNYIQKDRYKETTYQEEKKLLTIKENKAYKLVYPECIQDVSKLDAQVRLGKDSLELGKDSIESGGESKKPRAFTPPTLQEVSEYCNERRNGINPQNFIDHYTANGWMRGKTKIKDWKACIRTWENKRKQSPQSGMDYLLNKINGGNDGQ